MQGKNLAQELVSKNPEKAAEKLQVFNEVEMQGPRGTYIKREPNNKVYTLKFKKCEATTKKSEETKRDEPAIKFLFVDKDGKYWYHSVTNFNKDGQVSSFVMQMSKLELDDVVQIWGGKAGAFPKVMLQKVTPKPEAPKTEDPGAVDPGDKPAE